MTRSVEEWVGKNDDSKVPPRVRLRIFERENGVCHLTGVKIQPGDRWDLDHKVALILGGEHREANLFPALVEAHRRKTATEVAIKSKIARVKKKHLGIDKPKSGGFSQRFRKKLNGDVVDTRTGEIINQRLANAGRLREKEIDA